MDVVLLDTFSQPGKVKLSYFYGLEKHRSTGILNQILQDNETKLFKTQKKPTKSLPVRLHGVEQGQLHLFIIIFSKTTHHCT